VANFILEGSKTAVLKHNLLVTIYDVGEEDGLPYIVQEYIAGENLAEWAAKRQPSFSQVVQILVGVAEALGFVHQHRLTHCDLKLANVLMDQDGKPHVADFGLAVHESARLHSKGARFGTPPMMAPEQVRGEGHRLDGRTDIWAMGVMMYQLLVAQKPFTATDRAELFNEIETLDPTPPRQIDRTVPRELERICLKCLSKRRTDRYNSTDD
jgi:serine/threonine protein kinase